MPPAGRFISLTANNSINHGVVYKILSSDGMFSSGRAEEKDGAGGQTRTGEIKYWTAQKLLAKRLRTSAFFVIFAAQSTFLGIKTRRDASHRITQKLVRAPYPKRPKHQGFQSISEASKLFLSTFYLSTPKTNAYETTSTQFQSPVGLHAALCGRQRVGYRRDPHLQ